MLYTVVSEYDVFFSRMKFSQYQDISGGKIEYILSGKNKVIKSLFSTDPRLYLEKRYQPGQKL